MRMPQQNQAPPIAVSRKPLVVFVDDEPEILLALERSLRSEPYDFLMTTDPQKALHWIRTRPVNAVIADYRMPGMSGTSLLEMSQAHSPHIARILLTAYSGECDVLRAREAGAVMLFAKPWDDLELRQTILELLKGHQILEVTNSSMA